MRRGIVARNNAGGTGQFGVPGRAPGICLAMASMLALAACTLPSSGGPAGDEAWADSEQPESKLSTLSEAGSGTLPDDPTFQDPTGAEPPKLVALPPEPVIEDDPEKLIGLGPSALAELLGEPRRVRRETPAEIWQYVGNGCVFDIFLYQEPGGFRVVHAEARDDKAALKTESRACLNQLLRARLNLPVS